MKLITGVILSMIVIMAAGCTSRRANNNQSQTSSNPGTEQSGPVDVTLPAQHAADIPLTGSAGILPKATAFKMSGDYADKVAVTIGADGKLSYYPAPTDLTPNSEPVAIGDGWWLNRQGLGANSVFTKWTFAEYRAMKAAPTPQQILAAVIPGACVTQFCRLPITANEALQREPASLLEYLK